MKILFLTLSNFKSVTESGLYQDLVGEFLSQDHLVDVICPTERRNGEKTHLISEGNCRILRVRIPNIQKANVLEKMISTLSINFFFSKAYNKYFSTKEYDIVLYVTPPITLNGLIKKVKSKDGAFSYLLLKDIFPQNAVDLGMMNKNSFIYKFFKLKEIELYKISDRIGCMSPANSNYILNQNPFVSPSRVEVNPNSVNLERLKGVANHFENTVKQKYNIPENSVCFIFGGNLGKPQGVEFMTEAINACREIDDAFFVIVGSGTMFGFVRNWVASGGNKNILLLESLPKEEYELLLDEMNVGLIFLDHRFTIPNFPSRVLSYMEKRIPVVVCTDTSCDLGEVTAQNGFGYYVESNDTNSFHDCINEVVEKRNELKTMGIRGFNFMKENYSTFNSVNKIIDGYNNRK